MCIRDSVYMGMTISGSGPIHMLKDQSPSPVPCPNNRIAMQCGRQILLRNLQHDTALEIQHHAGGRAWCETCRAQWPSGLDEALFA